MICLVHTFTLALLTKTLLSYYKLNYAISYYIKLNNELKSHLQGIDTHLINHHCSGMDVFSEWLSQGLRTTNLNLPKHILLVFMPFSSPRYFNAITAYPVQFSINPSSVTISLTSVMSKFLPNGRYFASTFKIL